MKSSDSLSFEDLGAIYRTEKKSTTLSAVRRDLYPSMAGLIIDLRTEYEKHLSADPDSIICEGVNQRRKKAILMSKEITEIRMGKIASLALMGARGGQNALDHLTPEERDYYDNILDISRRHLGITDRLSGKRKFETPEIDPKPTAEKKAPLPIQAEPERAAEPAKYAPEEPAEEELPKSVPEEPEKADPEEDGLMVIRILEDLPPFSGPDRNYELFKEDVVRMPKSMAMALVSRNKAVTVSPGP